MIKLLLMIIAFLSSSAYAQPVILTEADVIRLALERNETVGIAQAELERAQKQTDSVSSDLYPVLSARVAMQKGKATGTPLPNGDDWNENANVSLTQSIYSFGRLGSAIDIADSTLSLSKNRQLATEAEVRQMAKKLYYAVLYGQDLVDITTESYQNARKNKETLEKRVSYGRISRNDNLKMLADLASRRPRLVDAKRSLAVSKLELANFLALPEGSDLKIQGNLQSVPNLQLDIMDDSKLNSLADIRMLQDSLVIGRKSVDFARAERFPTLSAFGSYAPTTYRDDFLGTEVKKQETITVGVALTFDWPFGGGKNYEVQIKKVEQRIAELRLQAGKRLSKTKYRSLTTQFESLQEKLQTELEAVRLAESSYKVALSAFSTGSVSQLQLNDSELLLSQNKISLAATRLDIFNTAADLERLLANGNEGTL